MPVIVLRWMPLKNLVRAVAAVFGLLLFRMREAGRGAPSTTMIWPSLEPVATSLLPSWSMIETQQTPERLAAALTAGFLSTWTMAISSADGCPEGLSRGDRRPGCLVRRRFPRLSRASSRFSGRRRESAVAVIIVRRPQHACAQGVPGFAHEDETPPDNEKRHES